MLKLLFLTIILYIIIQHLLDDCEETETPQKIVQESEQKKVISNSNQIRPVNQELDRAFLENKSIVSRADSTQYKSGMVTSIKKPDILNSANKDKTKTKSTNSKESFAKEPVKQIQKSEPKLWEFDKPNPWTKVILNDQDEYPYNFHIKIAIPSLNDYQVWKQIVPNLEFNPRTGELIIPSKEEASALALANLICINFSGQMSIENILEKNLIQISVSKARSYEVVQNKLREQIMENLYGKSVTKVQTSFEQDLARNSLGENTGRVDFTSEQFSDTFEHFSNQSQSGNNSIEAYDGSDYSYL